MPVLTRLRPLLQIAARHKGVLLVPAALLLAACATTTSAPPDMPTAPERDPYVPMPNCTLSVSPWTIETCSNGMPSRSLTSCANVVSLTWPWAGQPVSTSTAAIPSAIRVWDFPVPAGPIMHTFSAARIHSNEER